MDNIFVGKNIKRLRTEAGLSQEELADKVGVTSQAVSKWECAQSLPDLSLILPLADLFGVCADKLLREDTENICPTKTVYRDFTLPNDGKLRILQFCGNRKLSSEEADELNQIKLLFTDTERNVNVEITGNATIEGDIGGDLSAGNNVTVDGEVDGDIRAGNKIYVEGEVAGDIIAGYNVTVDGDVGGDISAGNNVSVDGDVGGDINAG